MPTKGKKITEKQHEMKLFEEKKNSHLYFKMAVNRFVIRSSKHAPIGKLNILCEREKK